MALETLLRTGRILFEQKYFQKSKQLFHLLFKTEDMDDTTTVLLDEFTDSPVAVPYRDKNNQAHLREYIPGSGTLYEPPIADEQTPVDEKLRDQAVEGSEATAGFNDAQMRKVDKIINTQTTDHMMTKNKQAIDEYRDGVFYAKGITSNDIGKNEVFARDVANDLTADFSSVTIDQALAAGNDQLNDQDCSQDNRFAIMGKSFQKEFETDTNVIARMQANPVNELVMQKLSPSEWAGTQGLKWFATYRPAGSSVDVQLFSYNPGIQYKAYKGATAEPWIPDDEMIMGSFDSPSYRIYRGIDVVNETVSKILRVVGELVFDSYISASPVAEFFRSHTRHLFLMGNINHTLRSTGSNF
jgi:hypothetical protein